jgi:hypothetical protein
LTCRKSIGPRGYDKMEQVSYGRRKVS